MNVRKRIKQNARHALGGNWGKATCLYLLCLSVFVIFSLFQGLTSLLTNIPDFQDIYATPWFYLDDIINTTLPSILLSAGFTLISLLINTPLSFGVKRWYYQLVGGCSEDILTAFSFFESIRRFFQALWCMVQLLVRQFLWGILFHLLPAGMLVASYYLTANTAGVANLQRFGSIMLLVLGVCFTMFASVLFALFCGRYFLAAYLLVEDDSRSVATCIRTSVRFMRDKKGELFLFRLSFLPWWLLSALILPLLYVVPYYNASQALLAKYYIQRGVLQQQAPTLAPEEQEEEPLSTNPAEEPAASSFEEPEPPTDGWER